MKRTNLKKLYLLFFTLLCSTTTPSLVKAQSPAATQQSQQMAFRLNVSGTKSSISIDAERADVVSTLRAVLKQANQQFVHTAGVTGQVTLVLQNQPLEVVLMAICEPNFLTYSKGSDGIYRFTRDDKAIRQAFASLQSLNQEFRAQLLRLGLQDNYFKENSTPQNYFATGRANPDFGVNRNSGTSNLLADSALPPSRSSKMEEKTNDLQRRSPQKPGIPSAPPKKMDSALMQRGTTPKTNAAQIPTKYLSPEQVSRILGSQQKLSKQPDGSVLRNENYTLYLRSNNLVSFNIPVEKPEPVANVLQLLGEQANTTILIDPSIPNSLRFRIWGVVSPRLLPEALNIVAPAAKLQWRWIGNTVFVTPLPEISVYLNDTRLNSPLVAEPKPADKETKAKSDQN